MKASIPVIVVFTALIDSESSESYIHPSLCSKLNLTLYPSSHEVRMASTSVKVKSLGFSLSDIVVRGSKYALTRLNVFPTLCCDINLGLDFQSQHQRVIFELGCNLQDMVVSHDENCSVTVAETQEVSLFSNLTAGVKPITTKSRRFSHEDRLFIQDNVDKMLSEGVIRPSSSPWRVQVLIVKYEANGHEKKLCIDYLQTINIYTELDAYPLPRIDDMTNDLSKYCVFWTFDLRSADHQIKIVERDCKYTAFAFEANGELYEFFTHSVWCQQWSCSLPTNPVAIR